MAVPRHPVLLLSLEGVRAHGQLPQRSMWECPVNVGLGSFAGILLLSGVAILVCKMVNCKNSQFCRKNRGIRSKIDAFFPRGCYELAQEWLTNAENRGPTENRTNRGIRIPMRFSAEFITRSNDFDKKVKRSS